MTSEDTYRASLQGTIEGLRYWVPSVADVAHVVEGGGPDYWHLGIAPRTAGGCPFEILLRHNQTYDLVLAGETYEFKPVTSLTAFLPLAEALIEGRVVQRRWFSSRTGKLQAVESLVYLADGSTWREGPGTTSGDESRDRHFLPYRR